MGTPNNPVIAAGQELQEASVVGKRNDGAALKCRLVGGVRELSLPRPPSSRIVESWQKLFLGNRKEVELKGRRKTSHLKASLLSFENGFNKADNLACPPPR